jgi:hypothetical protein
MAIISSGSVTILFPMGTLNILGEVGDLGVRYDDEMIIWARRFLLLH